MKIIIDTEILSQNNITEEEFLYLLLNSKGIPIIDIKKSLLDKKIVENDIFSDNQIVLSENAIKFINNIILDSSKNVQATIMNFEEIAEALKQCYINHGIKGRKSGTTYQWLGNKSELISKLKNIVAKYNANFTLEEAVSATNKFLDTFLEVKHGDTQYLPLLKYYILKTDKETKEIKSDLLTAIENLNQEDNDIGDDWTSTLR